MIVERKCVVEWWSKNKLEIIILLLLGVIVDIRFYEQICGSCVTFADTDDYMRLVRIRDFFLHHDLANTVISRCNVPFGCDLHWTRFYDFFIIIPAYILNIFIDSNKSIEYVGLLIGPVLRSITTVTLFSLCQKFMKKNNAFLTTEIFPSHPLIYGINHLGRPDHHAFIMLFMVVYLKSVIEVALAKFNGENLYLKPAIIAT
ncbi:MAG: hypothetical protein LBF44_00285, partial [Holosporaceae bacterium]|nr:hypothetical protein [Holosporaceae bacterium]